ncbi:MAG TPA: endonuclease [Bacteroidales bacterium]|nr:endonuclease [Bacteroidales bacterium]
MFRVFSIIAISLFFYVNLFAQAPAGYYNSAQGLTGIALRAALHNIIDDHNSVSYNSLYTYFESTDKKNNNTVWDMYSDVPGANPPYTYMYNSSDECGNYNNEGDCFNREHSWPASWFNDSYPAYSDLFHLYPTDGYVNNRRSNHPFGEVGSASWTSQNGSKVGTSNYSGWTGVTVFEPIDEYKGDFARTYFYMSTRYYTEDASWPASYNSMVNRSNINPKPLEMLLQWHHSDPVSTKEINRNNAVYAIQGNRNPFIDNPEYADAIWDPNYQTSYFYSLNKTQVFPNPANDWVYVVTPQNYITIHIRILDTFGNTMFSNEYSNCNEIQIDISNYNKGCYCIMMHSDTEMFTEKIMIF